MDYSNKLETLLGDFCDEKINQAQKIDDRYAELWQHIKHYLMAGGKRMRPRLVMMAYEAYGGKNPESVIAVAAAWELLHACLLVHDDIIDRDLVRHGEPNITGMYQSMYNKLGSPDANHYALSAALIGGDLLLMSAYELVGTASISSDQKLLAQSYLSKATFAVAGGELIDTDSVLYDIEETDPITVAKYKTASYSLQLPTQCGAALAGAAEDELEKLSTIGLHVGIAYQFQDDLLGVFGNSIATGKSNRSDIVEKKRTLLIHETLKGLDTSGRNRLQDLYVSHAVLSDEEAEEIVRLINESGARESVSKIIEHETALAIDTIKTMAINQIYKDAFLDLVSKLTTRIK